MKRFIFLPLLLALLAGSVITAHAQTTQAPGQAQTQDDSGADADVQASDVAQNEEETDASAQQADDADAEEADDSTARFIPTEQVSQDLGVSFPVDI